MQCDRYRRRDVLRSHCHPRGLRHSPARMPEQQRNQQTGVALVGPPDVPVGHSKGHLGDVVLVPGTQTGTWSCRCLACHMCRRRPVRDCRRVSSTTLREEQLMDSHRWPVAVIRRRNREPAEQLARALPWASVAGLLSALVRWLGLVVALVRWLGLAAAWLSLDRSRQHMPQLAAQAGSGSFFEGSSSSVLLEGSARARACRRWDGHLSVTTVTSPYRHTKQTDTREVRERQWPRKGARSSIGCWSSVRGSQRRAAAGVLSIDGAYRRRWHCWPGAWGAMKAR